MMIFGVFLAMAFLMPDVLGLIIRFLLTFLSLFMGAGVGLIAWSIAGSMGYAEFTWPSYLMYAAAFGIPTTIFIFSSGS